MDEPLEHAGGDEVVADLARLFAEHPAWRSAARRLDQAATSTVFFSHRPGEGWHLERNAERTFLLPGVAEDPDFVFCFTPASVARLAAVEGSVGSFAVELFRLITDARADQGVRLRIAASFSRLLQRGYLGLLAAGGGRVLAFGAVRGVRTVGQLRRLVDALRKHAPEPWEHVEEKDPVPRGRR